MFLKLESIRSLGFGGLLGAGLAGLLRIQFSGSFPQELPIYWILVIGAFLGAGIHHCGKPLLRLVGYYLALAQIYGLTYVGAISKKKKKELIERITDFQFLSESNNAL